MTSAQLWAAALGELQLQMNRANFDTYLKDTFPVSYEDGLFVVGVSSPFAVETLEQRLAPMIRKVLSGILGRDVDLRFEVRQKRRSRGWEDSAAPLDVAPWQPAHQNGAYQNGGYQNGGHQNGGYQEPSAPAGQGPLLNPKYSFDTFVVGKGNQLAHAACQAVADDPARAYNPLFVYGGVGLGKTHLMHAIGHQTRQRELRVLYVSSETFTNELIDSIQKKRTEEFRNKYRRVQVLLVDDIQFIAGKERTQEEFFHTFNAIHEASGQIVISSDRPPKAISTLEDRLRSRFEWGLIADVQAPDLETRIAILRSKCQSQGIVAPEGVLEAIAAKVQSNIRELEGSLNRVVALAAVTHEPISIELAASALHEMLFNVGKKSVNPESILRTVASYYNVSSEDLSGKARDRRVMTPRQVAMYLLREETELPLVEIGRMLGGRDHTTVLHSVEKIAAELTPESPLSRDLERLRESLYSPKG